MFKRNRTRRAPIHFAMNTKFVSLGYSRDPRPDHVRNNAFPAIFHEVVRHVPEEELMSIRAVTRDQVLWPDRQSARERNAQPSTRRDFPGSSK